MERETKNCQNCNQDFIIEPEDFLFYDKMKVPPPTFCPQCRLMRRLSWRNERNLYKRKCDAPGHTEDIISMYSKEAPVPIYDPKFWWSDEWNPSEYSLEIDFSIPFLEQWKTLFNSIPTLSLINLQDVNSDFCNFTYQSKNCYLNFASDMNEDTAYLYHSIENRNSYDMLGSRKNENCYELIDSDECYSSMYLTQSSNCIDSKFCNDCRGCSHCIGCVGLRNSKYCIFNKQYSPEDYKNKIEALNLQTFSNAKILKEEFNNFLSTFPRKFLNSRYAIDSTGDYLNGVKNCKDCFDIEGPMEDSRYVVYGVTDIRSVYDGYAIGVNIENAYDVMDCGSNVSDTAFSGNIWEGYANRYCYFVKNCSNCFGCVGIKHKQYCILNKQYSREEYEELLPKIIKHMIDMPYRDSLGRVHAYGEFFPSELSPFAYNESIAQEWFPHSKEWIQNQGYRWKDKEERSYVINIQSKDLPEFTEEVNASLIGKIIECAHMGKCEENCTEGFKMIPEEFSFYKKMNLSIPRLCPNCRHYQRLQKRNPMKLWHRQCMCDLSTHTHKGKCEVEFETSYAPDRPEKVYCEKCYQAEVI